MKKIYWAAMVVAALTTLGSCSQDEVLNTNPEAGPQAIEFSTYTGNTAQTRGTIVDNNNLGTYGFGVLAYYTGEKEWSEANESTIPNFMYNQLVNKADGATSWSYTPVKYWPTMDEDKISFFAYAPYDDADKDYGIELNLNDATGNPTVDFTVKTDPTEMVDFVTARAIDQMHNVAKNATEPNNVSLAFKHTLTRLAFQAKLSQSLEADKSYVIVRKAELLKEDDGGKFYSKAKYTFDEEMILDFTFSNMKPVYTERSFGTWSDHVAIEEDWDITDILIKNNMAFGENKEEPYAANQGLQLTTDQAVSMFNAENTTDKQYLFLIPVPDAYGLPEGSASIRFEYDIITVNETLKIGYSITKATKTVYLPKDIMQQATAYNLTFIFDVNDIVLDANVVDWKDDVNNEVNIKYTPDAPESNE